MENGILEGKMICLKNNKNNNTNNISSNIDNNEIMNNINLDSSSKTDGKNNNNLNLNSNSKFNNSSSKENYLSDDKNNKNELESQTDFIKTVKEHNKNLNSFIDKLDDYNKYIKDEYKLNDNNFDKEKENETKVSFSNPFDEIKESTSRIFSKKFKSNNNDSSKLKKQVASHKNIDDSINLDIVHEEDIGNLKDQDLNTNKLSDVAENFKKIRKKPLLQNDKASRGLKSIPNKYLDSSLQSIEKDNMANKEANSVSKYEKEKSLKEKTDYKDNVKTEKTKKPKTLKIFSLILYISFIICLIGYSINFAAKQNVKSILGFNFSYINSEVLEPEIPKGSLAVNKIVESYTINEGDIITYLNPEIDKESQTAKVMNLYTNFEQTGKTAFSVEDKSFGSSISKFLGSKLTRNLVHEDMVIGKLTYSSLGLGKLLSWLNNNAIKILIVFVLLFVVNIILKRRINKKKDSKESVKELDEKPNIKNEAKNKKIAKLKNETISNNLNINEENNVNENNIAPQKPTKVAKIASLISNTLFVLVLVLLLIVAITYGGGENAKNIFGHSYLTVLSKSMEREIPKGSLVITKNNIPPEDIHVGDTITFMDPEKNGKIITHKVIEVYENYEETNSKAFKTQGVENNSPDKEPALAANVIGVVQFHIPYLGGVILAIAKFITKNIIFIGIMIALSIILSIALKAYLKDDSVEEENNTNNITEEESYIKN